MDRIDVAVAELSRVAARIEVMEERLRATVELYKVRIDTQDELISELKDKLEENEHKLADLVSFAHKWQGGFILLVALGGTVGWLMSQAEHILKFIRG